MDQVSVAKEGSNSDFELGEHLQEGSLEPRRRDSSNQIEGDLDLQEHGLSFAHLSGFQEDPCDRFLLQNRLADVTNQMSALERINGELRMELAEQKALVEVHAQEVLAKDVSLKAMEDKLNHVLKLATETNEGKQDIRAAIRDAGMRYETELDFLRATVESLKPQKAELEAENKRLLQDLYDCKKELITAKMHQHTLNTLDLNSVPGATFYDELDRARAAHFAEKLQLTDALRSTQAKLKEAQEKILEKSCELASVVTLSDHASLAPDIRVEELKAKARLLEDSLATKKATIRSLESKLEKSNSRAAYSDEKVRFAEARLDECKRQRDVVIARLEAVAIGHNDSESLLQQLKEKDQKISALEEQARHWKTLAEENADKIDAAAAKEMQNADINANKLDEERAVKEEALMKMRVYAAAVKKMKSVVDQKNGKVEHLKHHVSELKAKLDNSVPKEDHARLQAEVNKLQLQMGTFGDALFMRGDELEKLLK